MDILNGTDEYSFPDIINKYYKPHTCETYEQIQERKALSYEIFEFCVRYGPKSTIEKYESDILKLRSPFLSYHFCVDVPGANIKEHALMTLDCDDHLGIIAFARDFAALIGTELMDSFEKCILNSGIPYSNYSYAKQVKGADIKAHEKVVLNGFDVKADYMFALEIPDADIEAHINKIKHSIMCELYEEEINELQRIVQAQKNDDLKQQPQKVRKLTRKPNNNKQD